ncbi:MAG: GNAT family N-acetyltransferase [Kiritimatiellae bacterium]|nr:GNAT family N-acetyltransferase [Kiritimatiellia bacterium]
MNANTGRDDVALVEADVGLRDTVWPMLLEMGKKDGGFAGDTEGLTRETFAEYVAKLTDMAKGRNLPDGYVPMNTFWLLAAGERPLGVSRLRHRLTPGLLEHGGHIGYWIRPRERRKGYGTRILALTLQRAAALGIPRALLTCHAANCGSRRIIQKNGGVLEPEDARAGAGAELHFWIDIRAGGVSFEIRRYEPADHDAVWHLHNVALNAVGAHAGNGAWDADLHAVESVYLNGTGEFLVAVQDGAVVGMGALRHRDATHAEIKRIRVDPSCQRQGIGCAILAELEKRAKALGYRVLRLDTTTRQAGAQRFYEKNGFVPTGRSTHGLFELILYEKRLA